MLKFSVIFKRNGAHLVLKKDIWKKKNCCFEHAKIFLIYNEWKIFLKTLRQSKLLCFAYDFANIQKYSFKECPLT
jgi:hypothetical protein